MLIIVLASDRGRNILFSARFVYSAIDEDNIEFVMVLQNLNLLNWVPVYQDAVSIIAWCDLAELFGSHEELRNAESCGDDCFVSCKAEEILEVSQITGVCAVRSPSEAVVAIEEVSGIP